MVCLPLTLSMLLVRRKALGIAFRTSIFLRSEAGGCFNFIIGCDASSRTASELESGSKVVEHVLRSLACPRHITFTQSLETLTNICKASFRRGDSPVRDALRR